jgi:ATP-binding cassette subfamily C (CFTR/MRP) protein 1
MDFSGCIDDDSFGPTIHGCRDNFDFTIKFENIFFSIIPSSLFIVIALGRTVILSRRPEAVGGCILRGIKLVATNVYCALKLSLLILSSNSTKYGARVLLVTSTSVSFCSSVCIIGLSYLEHSRSARPAILLNAYLILTILFDVTQLRTLWIISTNPQELIFSRLFTASVAVKAILTIIESQNKSRWMQWDVERHSPEETTGIFGLIAYTWLGRIFLAGYTKILTLDDLFPLDQSMATGALQLRLMDNLRSSKSKGQKNGLGLAKAMAKTLKISLLLPIGPRAALIAFKFCQPFLINILLEYLEQPADHASRNRGYGLIGATILIYTGIAIFTALYWYLHERTLCMSRGSLAGAVYKKTTEAKLTTVGASSAITLMSADVERIRLGFLNLHEFWANCIEVGLAGWLLYRQ